MEKRRPSEVKSLVRDPKWQRQDLASIMLLTAVLSHEKLAIDPEEPNWASGIGVEGEGSPSRGSFHFFSTCPMTRAAPGSFCSAHQLKGWVL